MQSLSIANGELYQRLADGSSREIKSPFAKEVIERDENSRRHNSWKVAPRDEESKGMLSGAALWGQRGQQPGGGMPPARFLYACRGRDEDTLYYLLNVGRSVGLFRRHLKDDREVRLFHRDKTPVLGMSFDSESGHIIVANGNPDGTAQLDVYDEEGTHKGSITGGDSVDAAPSMIAGQSHTLLYQSSGVARHAEHGYVVAMGHSEIHRLNYKTGKLDTL
ncbi:MAG: hypothetical protein ACRDAM_17985, partial [Casimicrobium sp.]